MIHNAHSPLLTEGTRFWQAGNRSAALLMEREALRLNLENEDAWLVRRAKIGTVIEIHR
jgi:hypothetical protein